MSAFAAGTPARAEYEVRDPGHLLDQLDQYLAAGAFADEFQSGDTAKYTRLHKDCYTICRGMGCGTGCTNVNEAMTRITDHVTATQATVELDDGTQQPWTADQFNSLHGDAVRYDVRLLDFQYPGYLEVSELNDRSYTTPAGKTIAGKEIVFLFHPRGFEETTSKIRYTVSKDYPVAGQIVQVAAFGLWLYQLTEESRPLVQEH
jgi:hypothetical protein